MVWKENVWQNRVLSGKAVADTHVGISDKL